MSKEEDGKKKQKDQGKRDNPPQKFSVDEKELGEIYDSAALKMAKEVAAALNGMLDIPVEGSNTYRKYKKRPKDKLAKVLAFLIEQATTEQENKEPDDHLVIKQKHKKVIHEMVVERQSVSAVQEYLFKKFNDNINKNTLTSYMVKFKKSNEYLKGAREWVESSEELRLYHKRGRLGELEELYLDAYRRWKKSPSKTNADMCLKILEQARKEAMPIMNQITVNSTNNIQQNIFTNILAKEEQIEIFNRLPLHEIIIGKVAAKQKRDPYLLQRRLQHSYYAAQSGARGMDKLKEDIEYPTSILYNVEDLRGKWNEIQIEEAKILENSDTEEKIAESPNDIKAALLKRLREKQSDAKPKDDEESEK